MLALVIRKETLLTPLLTVAGAVDKKQSMPILANVLLQAHGQNLTITGTDLEIQVTVNVPCVEVSSSGAVTVPAKKLVDIIRSLDESANPTVEMQQSHVLIKHNRSQFKLATLPASDYPLSQDEATELKFSIPKDVLVHLLQSTSFAMAQQDVRIFLNALLLDISPSCIAAVATDGHRLSLCRYAADLSQESRRLLVPKKGVVELLRLLNHLDEDIITLSAGKNHLTLKNNTYTFTTKLVDARFPAYEKAIPKQQVISVIIDRDAFRQALARIIILANEKSKGVTLSTFDNELTIIAINQEQEEALETLSADISGEPLKVGINASYLLDVLSHLPSGPVQLSMKDSDSSILVESKKDNNYLYVIMPMRI